MFKSNHLEIPKAASAQENAPSMQGAARPEPGVRGVASAVEQAYIGKNLVFHGEITGSESLVIDGRIEGTVDLPGNRVTVSRNGEVNARISAREVVVMGKARGDVSATDRVEIRSEGSLTGDVTAARISIEDGAYFKGSIDIRKAEAKLVRALPFADQEADQELKQA